VPSRCSRGFHSQLSGVNRCMQCSSVARRSSSEHGGGGGEGPLPRQKQLAQGAMWRTHAHPLVPSQTIENEQC
jgi:hypothetical protein